MSSHADKRTARRFQVPGATAAYRKQGAVIADYSDPCKVLNLSKGGLAIRCGEPVRPGTPLYVLLATPDEPPIELYARACWCAPEKAGSQLTLGVQYFPFDDAHGRYGYNSYQAYQVLERLEAHYVGRHRR